MLLPVHHGLEHISGGVGSRWRDTIAAEAQPGLEKDSETASTRPDVRAAAAIEFGVRGNASGAIVKTRGMHHELLVSTAALDGAESGRWVQRGSGTRHKMGRERLSAAGEEKWDGM